jgi:hypothetical protein
VRVRLARAVRHVLGSLVPPPPPAVTPHVPPLTTSLALPAPVPDEGAILRARAALAEARAEMPTLLQEAPPVRTPEPSYIPAEAAGLRQALRAYTDHVDRLLSAADDERRVLREQVTRLNEEVLMLRAEMDSLRALLPATHTAAALSEPSPTTSASVPQVAQPPVAAGISAPVSEPAAPSAAHPLAAPARTDDAAQLPTDVPHAPHGEAAPLVPVMPPKPAADVPATPRVQSPTQAPEASPHPVERSEELARFDARAFPAGTIGLLVALSPVDDFHRLTMVQERLSNEAGVESVELSSYEYGEARLRLTFRTAARGRWLREALERAAGVPLDPASLRFDKGVVSARLINGG